MRDRVQQREGRRVLRAAQDEVRDGADGDPPDVDGHHVRDPRQGRDGQDSVDHARLRTHRRDRRPRLPVGVPRALELLGRRGRHREVHRRQGRRQPQGQEDRAALSRLGLRQGTPPGPRGRGEEARLRTEDDSRAAPRQRAAVAVAADPPVPARLGHQLGLGRDERDGAADGAEGRLPARQDGRQLVGGFRDRHGRRGGRPRRATTRRA